MQRIKDFFKSTKTFNGIVTDIIEERVQYVTSEQNPTSLLAMINPPIPLCVVQTERGSEVLPKAGYDIQRGDKVKITETKYFCLLKDVRLEK